MDTDVRISERVMEKLRGMGLDCLQPAPDVDEADWRVWLDNLPNLDRRELLDGAQGVCRECGAPMVTRTGKYGRFRGCTTFPTCRYTEQ